MGKPDLLISQYIEISPNFKKVCSYDELIETEKRIKDKFSETTSGIYS